MQSINIYFVFTINFFIIEQVKVINFFIGMTGNELKYIAIGLMAFSFLGSAIGIGLMVRALIESIARNPSIEQQAAKYMFIGAGLVEAMGLFGLVIALILMFT